MFATADMLRIFQTHRGDAIVVPGRGGRHWAVISTRPNRDAPVGDPAMGGHASFALGLALARPNDKVVLFDSEGDLLMSLGILPTIAEQAPANFSASCSAEAELEDARGHQRLPGDREAEHRHDGR